eukprot:3710100-Amphidinium_carterae.2
MGTPLPGEAEQGEKAQEQLPSTLTLGASNPPLESGHKLSDVPGDGRCLYRSLAHISGSTWQQEYARIQAALRSPSQDLADAWHDVITPLQEADRLQDHDEKNVLPQAAWPGAQAVLAWAITMASNVCVLSTSGASLDFSYGHGTDCTLYLAYNGQHYRPYEVITQVAADYGRARGEQPPSATVRNKLLGTQLRKMETVALMQDWNKEHDDGLRDTALPERTHQGDDINCWCANINSLAAHLDGVLELLDLGADIVALSEHCLASWDTAATTSKLKEHSLTAHWRVGRVDAAGRATGGGLLLNLAQEWARLCANFPSLDRRV